MGFVAVNGSPRAGMGVTGGMLKVLADGMSEGGAAPEVFNLRDMNVKPCLGDWACWTRTPGRCSWDDDMNDLYPLLREARVLVLATPVYVDGMTGLMKTFVDRLVPLLDPMIELRDGHSRHPLIGCGRVDTAQIVLVSTCGFHETDNFEPLVHHVKAACKNLGRRYGGALLRPHGPVFGALLGREGSREDRRTMSSSEGRDARPALPPEAYAAALDVAAALREAGRVLAETGRLDEGLVERVGRPVLDRELYNRWVNAGWHGSGTEKR